ncbi:MAG: hypothetical protein INQ03_09005 [Candidatus Heimdallarchaeota archaeon]|nr:hypothetical protein [Candidatus Heimdallarchaeota archaeon]
MKATFLIIVLLGLMIAQISIYTNNQDVLIESPPEETEKEYDYNQYTEMFGMGLNDNSIDLDESSPYELLKNQDMGPVYDFNTMIYKHNSDVNAIAKSLDDKYIASASENEMIIWDLEEKEIHNRFELAFQVNELLWSTNHIIGSSGNDIYVWDKNSTLVSTLSAHTQAVNCINLNTDTDLLASGSTDSTIKIWDVTDGSLITSISTFPVNNVAWTDNFMISLSDGKVNWWNINDYSFNKSVVHGDHPLSLNIVGDSLYVLSGYGYTDSRFKKYNVSSMSVIKDLQNIGGKDLYWDQKQNALVVLTPLNDLESYDLNLDEISQIRGFNFKHLISIKNYTLGVNKSSINVVNIDYGYTSNTISAHSSTITAVTFSPNGKSLASTGSDNTIKIWNTSANTEISIYYGHTSVVTSLAYSPDGGILASGSWDNTVKLWDTSTNTEITSLHHSDSVTALAYSPDGSIIASGTGDDTIKLWDTSSNTEIIELSDFGSLNSLSYSPDGDLIASGTEEGTITLWDTSTYTEFISLAGHPSPVKSLQFSPDGSMLASGSDSGIVKLWDTSTNTEIAALSGHSANVFSVAFSPDGRILASGSADKTIKFWDISTNIEITSFIRHTSRVFSIAFSPDGEKLASGDEGGVIKLRDIKTDLLQFSIMFFQKMYSMPVELASSQILIDANNGFRYSWNDSDFVASSSTILTPAITGLYYLKIIFSHEILLDEELSYFFFITIDLNDYDLDGMNSNWEINNSLDPFIDDTFQDKDGDGLSNLEEYNLGTYANNNDTDADSMLDKYEVNNGLDPLVNDADGDLDEDGLSNQLEHSIGTYSNNNDTDSDTMTDFYEYNNDLDPLTDDTSLDEDLDGLTNLEEYNLGTYANNNDSDADSMLDKYEVDNGLDPLIDDADGDLDEDGIPNWYEALNGLKANDPSDASQDDDEDGLTNLEEFQLGTRSDLKDTDGDGLDDKYEVDNELNPTNEDTDADGLPDGWEVDNDLDPKTSDADGDLDNDGLSNSEEYDYQTQANNADTDGDGMTDGWEIDNGLDAKTDDASADADADGLSNLGEFNAGTDPNNQDSDGDGDLDGYEVAEGNNPLDASSSPTRTKQITTIVIIVASVTILSLLSFIFLRKRKLGMISSLGFTTAEEYQQAKSNGFSNASERDAALKAECLTMKAYEVLTKYEFSTATQLLEKHGKIVSDIDFIDSKIMTEELMNSINKSKNPIEIAELYTNFKVTHLQKISDMETNSGMVINALVDAKSLEVEFKDMTKEDLINKHQSITQKMASLKSKDLSSEFESRIKWFEPYQKILEVIQKTQAGIQVPLSRITDLSGATLEQTEGIIKLLLADNPDIGEYLEFEQIYIRGADVGSAIDDLLDDFEKFEKGKIGKLE